MPFVLLIFRCLHYHLGSWVGLAFILCDIVAAFFLGMFAEIYCRLKVTEKANLAEAKGGAFAEDVRFLFPTSSPDTLRTLVAFGYLFNPYIVASCVAQTTTSLLNMFLAVVLYALLERRNLMANAFLSLAAYQSLYPVILVIPTGIHLLFDDGKPRRITEKGSRAAESNHNKTPGLHAGLHFGLHVLTMLACWAALIAGSWLLTDSWNFLDATYGFLLSVGDLTPNVGLFWYFFTEMFDHFRLFFLWVFQMNLLIYILPLAIALRRDPCLLYVILVMLISIFKSYPSVADAGFYLALLPAFQHLFHFVRHGFVVGCALLCCSVLGPVMWFLWIHAGAANANFYFAITLLYSTAQIFLMTDLLYAYLRREIHLVHGMTPKLPDETETKVVLR